MEYVQNQLGDGRTKHVAYNESGPNPDNVFGIEFYEGCFDTGEVDADEETWIFIDRGLAGVSGFYDESGTEEVTGSLPADHMLYVPPGAEYRIRSEKESTVAWAVQMPDDETGGVEHSPLSFGPINGEEFYERNSVVGHEGEVFPFEHETVLETHPEGVGSVETAFVGRSIPHMSLYGRCEGYLDCETRGPDREGTVYLASVAEDLEALEPEEIVEYVDSLGHEDIIEIPISPGDIVLMGPNIPRMLWSEEYRTKIRPISNPFWDEESHHVIDSDRDLKEIAELNKPANKAKAA